MLHSPSASHATILIACLGNQHRGDDAFGLQVAARLGAGTAHVRVLAHGGEPLTLIDAWRGVHHVVIVDAIAADLMPGTVVHLDVSNVPAPIELGAASTHALGAGGVIEMARALHELPPRVEVLAVAGREFAMGAAMSPEVAARVDKVVEMIREIVDHFAASAVAPGGSHA